MEPERSLPRLQEPSTCLYSEPDHSSSRPPFHFLKINFYNILPFTPGSFKWSLSLRLPHQTPISTTPVPIRAACSAHLIILDLITLIIFIEEYGSLSSIPLLPLPSEAQILSSPHYSQTPSAYVPPSM